MKKKYKYNLSVIIEKDEDGYYIGHVPALASCYTQAKTLPTLYKRLKEVVDLCLQVETDNFKRTIPQNTFVGIQQLEFKG
ncbi:MAG: hypothetical protein CMI52_01930 [Parcubacteria group bacterium]|nr:hypothetical protein [Parcubacteria group bacterium]|tara:strand:- start:792 stop:1031 length:240 start_codon:yes stop_codon:yes gene_type:complete